MIDHSRSFKSLDILKAPNDLKLFAKSTMDSLQNIDLVKLKACCSHYLSRPEMNTSFETSRPDCETISDSAGGRGTSHLFSVELSRGVSAAADIGDRGL